MTILSTYLRYKLHKIAPFLFALQLLGLLVLVIYYQLQIDAQQKERELFVNTFNAQPEWKDVSITDNTHTVMDFTYKIIEQGGRYPELLDQALELHRLTNQLIAEIDEAALATNLKDTHFIFGDLVGDYHDFLVEFSKETNLDTADRRVLIEAHRSNFVATDNEILKQQYKELKDRDTFNAYLTKIKTDIRLIENRWIEHLGGKIPDSCMWMSYRLEIDGVNRIWQGESLHLKAAFSRQVLGKRTILLEKNTLTSDWTGTAIYTTKVHKIGTHQIHGKILQKDGWGRTTAYPFTHKYTVLPKCN